jgi:NAD(P)-dependent dehydrogenase (short-subunit alcohol dehydrogenase family)
MAELLAEGERVLVMAGASGIGRAITEALVEVREKVHSATLMTRLRKKSKSMHYIEPTTALLQHMVF